MRATAILSGCALLATFAAEARGAELFTTTFSSGSSADFVVCRLLNASGKTMTVDVQIVGVVGNVVFDPGQDTVPAGQGTFAAHDGGVSDVYCHFTISGNANGVRASGALEPAAAPYNGILDAFIVPAQ